MSKPIPLPEEPADPNDTARTSSPQSKTSSSTSHAKSKQNEVKFCENLLLLLKSAGTTLIQSLTGFASFTSLVYFVSLKNDPKLMGCFGLGATLQFVFVYSFIIALNVGLSTVGSQAYGAGNPRLLGLYYKRAQIILMLVVIPMSLILANSASLFRLIGVEPELALGLQDVLIHLLPSSVAVGLFDAGKNYLISQKIFSPQSIIQIVSIVFDVSIQYTLIVHFDLGYLGIGLSRFLDEVGKLTMLSIFIKCSKKCQLSTVPWNKDCIKGLWKQFKEQLSAGGLMILDIFGSQIVLMQTAYLTPYEQAANSIGTRIMNFCLNFTWSLQTALSAFVGNSIGEQNEKKVMTFVKAGLLIDGVIVCVTWMFVGTQGENIARIFSTDGKVVHIIEGLIGLYLLICPADNLQAIFGGILRSSGKGKTVSRLFLVTYYPVSVPISLLFAHRLGYGIYGLYLTIFIVKAINAIVMIVMFKRLNIKEEMEKVAKNLKEEDKMTRQASKLQTSDIETGPEETDSQNES